MMKQTTENSRNHQRKGRAQTLRGPFASLGILAAIVAGANIAHAQVIRLNQEASVEARHDVRLGDISTVSGTDAQTAESLANTVILSDVEASRTVKAETVLLSLMSQRGAASLSNLQISGSAQCAITVGGEAKPAAKVGPLVRESAPVLTASVVPAAAKPSVKPEVPAAAISENPTLLKVIGDRVLQELKAAPEDVRVTINTISPLLEAPLPASRKWLCRPMQRTLLGTLQFEAQLVEGQKVIEKLTIQAKIERRQMVVVAMGKFDRGDVIAAGQVRVEEAWLDRTMPNLFADEKTVVGLEAQRVIEVGTMLDQRDFRQAMMAAKNDAVSVIYISGGLKVQMRGRAMEDGKMHDQIEVRNELTGERYQAVLIGKRLAVVGGTLDPAEEQNLREMR